VCEQLPTLRQYYHILGNPTVHDVPGQSISAALSSVVKQPGRESDYSPPSSAEVNNDWMYLHMRSPRFSCFGEGKN